MRTSKAGPPKYLWVIKSIDDHLFVKRFSAIKDCISFYGLASENNFRHILRKAFSCTAMLHIYISSSRFLTVFIRKHHIMHILTSLHWLPVYFRMTLNTVEACLGLAPGYLAAFLVSCESACSLTSLGGAFLVLPGCKSEGG